MWQSQFLKQASLKPAISLLASVQCSGTEGVVGVVGEAHLSGIKHLWETSSWRQLCDEMDGSSEMSSNASSDTVIWTPESQTDLSLESKLSASEMAGVKHALLQSVMRLKTVPSEFATPQRWRSHASSQEVPAAAHRSMNAWNKESEYYNMKFSSWHTAGGKMTLDALHINKTLMIP